MDAPHLPTEDRQFNPSNTPKPNPNPSNQPNHPHPSHHRRRRKFHSHSTDEDTDHSHSDDVEEDLAAITQSRSYPSSVSMSATRVKYNDDQRFELVRDSETPTQTQTSTLMSKGASKDGHRLDGDSALKSPATNSTSPPNDSLLLPTSHHTKRVNAASTTTMQSPTTLLNNGLPSPLVRAPTPTGTRRSTKLLAAVRDADSILNQQMQNIQQEQQNQQQHQQPQQQVQQSSLAPTISPAMMPATTETASTSLSSPAPQSHQLQAFPQLSPNPQSSLIVTHPHSILSPPPTSSFSRPMMPIVGMASLSQPVLGRSHRPSAREVIADPSLMTNQLYLESTSVAIAKPSIVSTANGAEQSFSSRSKDRSHRHHRNESNGERSHRHKREKDKEKEKEKDKDPERERERDEKRKKKKRKHSHDSPSRHSSSKDSKIARIDGATTVSSSSTRMMRKESGPPPTTVTYDPSKLLFPEDDKDFFLTAQSQPFVSKLAKIPIVNKTSTRRRPVEASLAEISRQKSDTIARTRQRAFGRGVQSVG